MKKFQTLLKFLNIKSDELEKHGSKLRLKNMNDFSDSNSIPLKKMHWLMGSVSYFYIHHGLSSRTSALEDNFTKSRFSKKDNFVFSESF